MFAHAITFINIHVGCTCCKTNKPTLNQKLSFGCYMYCLTEWHNSQTATGQVLYIYVYAYTGQNSSGTSQLSTSKGGGTLCEKIIDIINMMCTYKRRCNSVLFIFFLLYIQSLHWTPITNVFRYLFSFRHWPSLIHDRFYRTVTSLALFKSIFQTALYYEQIKYIYMSAALIGITSKAMSSLLCTVWNLSLIHI